MAEPLYRRIFARLSRGIPNVPYQEAIESASKIDALRKQAEGIQKKINALAEGASSIVYDPTIPPPITWIISHNHQSIRVRVGLTDRFAVYSIGAGWEIGQTMMGQKLIAIKDVDFELDSRTML